MKDDDKQDAEIPVPGDTAPHRRRPRYRGTHPRRFDQKYKEHDPGRYAATVEKVLASGRTPAGSHRPIMVAEVLEVLCPAAGETAVDATLGWGGHAEALLPRLLPGGRLVGLDCDPIELPRTEKRLRDLGFGPQVFSAHRSNFAGLPQVLAAEGLRFADCVVADLGVSSMQLDDPSRGFTMKALGPLDMRMNPRRGRPASQLIERTGVDALAALLADNADEPRAAELAAALAGHSFSTTTQLSAAVREALPRVTDDERELAVRRVFQALRIEVNDELGSLDVFLRQLPDCLRPGGRAAILTFHSGEDRRVKLAFRSGFRDGIYVRIADEVVRASPREQGANPRSRPAKLRWAVRA